MSDGHSCCGHKAAVHSVQQSLDEMDFERGIWSAALYGEMDRVRSCLRINGDPNAVDSSGYTALVSILKETPALRPVCLLLDWLSLEYFISIMQQEMAIKTYVRSCCAMGQAWMQQRDQGEWHHFREQPTAAIHLWSLFCCRKAQIWKLKTMMAKLLCTRYAYIIDILSHKISMAYLFLIF